MSYNSAAVQKFNLVLQRVDLVWRNNTLAMTLKGHQGFKVGRTKARLWPSWGSVLEDDGV